jgi:ATP:ADP antiporter, AAA family
VSDAKAKPADLGDLTLLDKALRIFADVRGGESPTALLLTLNVFLLLTAYYILKVAREPLILSEGGAEIKAYSSVAQSILLVPATLGYSALASRVGRMALSTWVTIFFSGCLVIFWFLGSTGIPIGIPFFWWVGIFNVAAVAQFWSFAADIYTDEVGKRLFPIIGIGASVGAVAGAAIADLFIGLGPYTLMLVAAALLGVCLALTFVVHRMKNDRRAKAGEIKKEEPIGGANGFALVFKDKYLLLFAAMIFVLNWVTKTGDYVFDVKILEAAKHAGVLPGDAEKLFIGAYKARYFEYVNVIGVVLQLFFVSRIIKYLGMRAALLAMPLASLLGYGATFVYPILGVLFYARVGESSLDYSLSNTTRNALWLVTARDVKYKAKQVIDSFFQRFGDAMSAGLIFVGTHLVILGARGFILVNLVLAGIWVVVAFLLARKYYQREKELPTEQPNDVEEKAGAKT